jgi:hypothetical protein
MSKYSFREISRFLLAGLILVLAQSGSLLAQERPAGLSADSTSSVQTQPVEIAAALPSAPSAIGLSGEPVGSGAVAPAPFVAVSQPAKQPEAHVFFDRQNKVLFAAVAAAATADFFTTRANLANGGVELNPITRVMSGSTAGLAANFALETSGSIAISYLFHKTGHHTLERMTSYVNISASIGAVAYGQTHR